MSNIYLTIIRHVLEYACEVWDGCYERDIDKLEKIRLEAARIVTCLTKFASKDSLYFETGWETLANRRKIVNLLSFIKFIANYALLIYLTVYLQWLWCLKIEWKVISRNPPKYYNEGPRKLNILHTRLRHQCSSLNVDLSRIHIINK